VKGCYHSIGKPSGELVICEGYATGASIHEATGYAVAVAFNAGNLPEVAQALHSKFPTLRLILAADDDWKTEGNPGLAKATEAAKAIGAAVAVPDFGANRPDRATDFNDLHQIAGISAVIQSIKAATTIDAPASKPRTEVMLLNGADLKPTPVSWLWRGWLALGKMHILAGAPGQGKTTIAIACGATVTIGGKWPDGSKSEKGNILIWSGEDDPADTLLPRLLAAGADKSRCYFVSGTRINGEIMPFDPARDMAALEAQAKHISGVRLLIVDPVVSAVTGDSHKNTEVRRALQPLVDLASRLNAAVIGISHFSKGTGSSDPASRVVGSIAFTAVARVVLVAAKVRDAQGNERRIFARGKSNIGADDGGFEYSIIQGEPLPGIEACYVAWGKAVEGTARELLAEPEQDDSGDKSVVDDAAEFLTQELADGTTPVKTLKANARDAGISWAAIRRASEGMPIIKTKAVGGWYWRMASHENSQHTLPAQGAQGAQDAQREHLEFDGKIQRNFNLLNTKNEHLDPKSTYFQGAQDVQREHLEHLEQAQRVDCFLSADDDSEVI
jgi:putative DNA primase/helicase